MSKLMKVWDHGKKTDPSATKNNTQGGRQSTSINGYWIIQKATELWGPIGSAWGYEILEDTLTDGVPIMGGENQETVLCFSKMHTIKLRLWYPESNDIGVTSYGHTPYIYKSKHGPLCDMEAPKKSLTDAIKKALSMLGFSADIFLGEWEDREYIKERVNEEAMDKAQDKDAEALKQAQEYDKWFSDHMVLIEGSVSANELKSLFTIMTRRCQKKGDDKAIIKITKAKDKRKLELEEKENAA
jgi:hypothetical protein